MGKGILVMGLHRGGTSAVAGVLHELGVFMGDDLLPPSKHNPKGYFEDRKFMEMHDRLIGDWKDPYLDMSDGLPDEYAALIEKHSEGHEFWGIKDPRLVFAMPAFVEAWDRLGRDLEDLRLIKVFRDPWAAAESLIERGGHTKDDAYDISLLYLSTMMSFHYPMLSGTVAYTHFPRIVFRRDIEFVARFCGLRLTEEQLEAGRRFLDPGLVHHGFSMETLE